MGRACRRPHECDLADRRVDDPLLAELRQQPFGDFEGAAECADVLAHAEDVPVALHLLEERLTNRFEIRDVGHQGFAPSAFQVPQLSGRSWP